MNEQEQVVHLVWEEEYWGPYEENHASLLGIYAESDSAEAVIIQQITEAGFEVPTREVDEEGDIRWVWVDPEDQHTVLWRITAEVVQ